MIATEPSFLSKVVDLLADAVCVVDAEGLFVFVNPACEDLFGYSREELIGMNMIELVHPEDRERTQQTAAEIMRGRTVRNYENRYVRKDGRIIHIIWSARWSEDDRLRLAVARDLTEHKHTERMREVIFRITDSAHADSDLQALYTAIHQVVSDVVPADDCCIALYERGTGLLSLPYVSGGREPDPQPLDPETPAGRVVHSGRPVLVSAREAETDAGTPDWLGVPLISPGGIMGALVVQNRSGGTPYTSRDQELLECVATRAAFVIERKQAESRLLHMAHHDALTDLPNRILFHDRFETALRQARRKGEHLALLCLDLDGFKDVNDNLGHVTGDRLLREVARRLVESVRESDTVGRLGGDEFTVLLTHIKTPADSGIVKTKIRAAIDRPFSVDGHTLSVSASIGTAVYPEDGDNPEALLRHADAGMYATKKGN